MDTTITDAGLQHAGVGLSAPLRLPGEMDAADASPAEDTESAPPRRNIFRRSRTRRIAAGAVSAADNQADADGLASDLGIPSVPAATTATKAAGMVEAPATAAPSPARRSRRGQLLAGAALVSALGAAGAGAWANRDRIAAFDWQALSPQSVHLPPSVVRVFDQVRHAVPLSAPQAGADPHATELPAPPVGSTASRLIGPDPVATAKTTMSPPSATTAADPRKHPPAGKAPASAPSATTSADFAEVAALKGDGPHTAEAAPPTTETDKATPRQPASSPASAAQARGPSEQGMANVASSKAIPDTAPAGPVASAAAAATPLRVTPVQVPAVTLAFTLPEPANPAPSAAELQAATRALASSVARSLPGAPSSAPMATEADLRQLQAKQIKLNDMLNETAAQLGDARTEVANLRSIVARLSKQVERNTSDFESRIGLNETALTLLKSRAALPAQYPAAAGAAPGGTPAAIPPPAAAPAVHHVAGPAALPGIPRPERRTVRDYVVKGASPGMAVLSALNPTTGNPAPIEVTVGDTVPGLGRVKSIAQHGTSWAVTTDGGVIEH